MNALIFDGSKENNEILRCAHDVLRDKLQQAGYKVNSFVLRDIKIAPCRGCFDCWLKTPGICVINDSGRDTTSAAMRSNVWVFLTSVTFGGYSSELKKAVDRLLPIFVPVFTKVNGEVHHKLRYKDYPRFIGIGLLESGLKDYIDIFDNLIKRNAINFRSSKYFSEILLSKCTTYDIRKRVKEILLSVGIT